MTQPSKGAAAFLTLFGLPFLCGGLAFIYAQLASHRNFAPFELALGIMVASVFVFIGGGFIYVAFHGYALLKQQAAREESNPLSPRSEEHTSELQSQSNLVCRLLLEKKTTSSTTDTSTAPSTPWETRSECCSLY